MPTTTTAVRYSTVSTRQARHKKARSWVFVTALAFAHDYRQWHMMCRTSTRLPCRNMPAQDWHTVCSAHSAVEGGADALELLHPSARSSSVLRHSPPCLDCAAFDVHSVRTIDRLGHLIPISAMPLPSWLGLQFRGESRHMYARHAYSIA